MKRHINKKQGFILLGCILVAIVGITIFSKPKEKETTKAFMQESFEGSSKN